jgi:dCTP deaminase
MILTDKDIKRLCLTDALVSSPMIIPYLPKQVKLTEDGVNRISHGQSSVGYDISTGTKIKIPKPFAILDPKNPQESLWDEVDVFAEGYYDLSPGAMVLAVSHEKFHMPSNVVGLCYGKSTNARNGILVNVTPLEPGWIGYLTIEISNVSANVIRVYFGKDEGIAQIVFARVEQPDMTYSQKGGKYQHQEDVATLGKV